MSGFELNKIAGAFLLAGVIAMTTAILAEGLYYGTAHHEEVKRGYEIDVPEVAADGKPAKPSGPEPITELIASAETATGQALTKKCSACHSFDKGGAHKVGPNMWGIYGMGVAAQSGYAYSDALKDHGGKWDIEQLNGFLWKPKKWVKGTKMGFAGLKKPEDRAAMVKYLQSLK